MAVHNFVIYSTLFILLSSANILASKSCYDTSPECLKVLMQSVIPSFVKENPDIGTKTLDPFVIDQLKLNLSGDLTMEFTHGTSKGFKNCVIDSARLYEDPIEKINNTLDLQFHCSLLIRGSYKSSGRLLMFAINGDGISTIKCKNIKIQLLVKLGSRLQEDGKNHLEIRTFKSSHTFEGQVYYRMTNLINGNPMLSELVVEFMNSNWKMVAEEFGTPIVEFGITSILNNVKKMFKAVPKEELVGRLDGLNV